MSTLQPKPTSKRSKQRRNLSNIFAENKLTYQGPRHLRRGIRRLEEAKANYKLMSAGTGFNQPGAFKAW